MLHRLIHVHFDSCCNLSTRLNFQYTAADILTIHNSMFTKRGFYTALTVDIALHIAIDDSLVGSDDVSLDFAAVHFKFITDNIAFDAAGVVGTGNRSGRNIALHRTCNHNRPLHLDASLNNGIL